MAKRNKQQNGPQQPAQPQPPQQQWVQGPPQPPKKKHTGCKITGGVIGAIIVVVVVIVVVVNLGGGSGTDTTASGGGGKTDKVIFKVDGKAKGLDIQYGSDSDTKQGPKKAPFKDTMKVKDDAQYYSVTAQLSGKGKIKCSVQIGDAVAKGSATGGYNICQVELVSDGLGGWEKA